ncbi:MAG TPA: TetR family transcriptional regulator [Nocardioidaceae bacterium]|nr:TetR family transcriptional regulator [Nocardioidaceae bacterium]
MARMSADERRDLLVQAAIRVMTRDGVANATTRSIVAEADMPLGVFHYCFRSKEELIEQVMVSINEATFDAALPALTGSETFVELVHGGLQAYWAHVVEDVAPHQLTYELTQYALRAAPEIARKQYESYLDLTGKYLLAIAELAQHTWDVPVEILARYLLAMIEGCTFQLLVDGDETAGFTVLASFGEHLARSARPAVPA